MDFRGVALTTQFSNLVVQVMGDANLIFPFPSTGTTLSEDAFFSSSETDR
jgi:hypothetical protein